VKREPDNEMKKMFRLWIACAACLFGGSAAGADAEFNNELARLLVPPTYLSMALSPDGKQIAAIHYDTTFSNHFLVLIDVDTLSERILVSPKEVQRSGRRIYRHAPVRVNWLGNELLAVDFSDRESHVVNMRGWRVRSLGERFIRRMQQNGADSDWVLVYRDIEDGDLGRVNVRTGETSAYRVSLPGKLVGWAFDASGALRAVTMSDTAFWSDETKISHWYRTSESSEWQLLEEAPVTVDRWFPIYVPDEPDSIVVLSRRDRDTRAVFRYDTKSRKHVELMAAHASEDVVGATGLEQDVFERVETEGLKPKTFWFDERWASLQESVNAALPGHVNRLSGNAAGRVLVHSYSDLEPSRWLVLDTTTMTMKPIARSRPHLDPKRMRPMEVLEYRSPDGFVVPSYLTRPADAGGPAPLVVLIHGGPNIRDYWGWNEEVQILAASGYAVFQPQFRGSAGFGRAFEHAGYGQWGLAMQDDITAGVQHLIDTKVADPKRICIYGANYGGYAALWGLVKTPMLYKCGVSFAGVSDIERMLNDWSDRNADPVSREIQRARIGDLKTRKQQFAEVSPLKHAARIQAPVFIAHGEDDIRVPPSHSRKMISALKEHGKVHEAKFFEDEGHALRYLKNEYQYYTALLRFLKRHIGDRPPGQ